MEPRDRTLSWDACYNARDLGGLPTRDGGRTRWGALIRTDTLCRLTPAGQAALVAHGVRTIVDVRFPHEIARDPVPHPFSAGAPDAPTYLNVPINSGLTPGQEAEVSKLFARGAASRGELNKLEIDVNPVGIARIVSAIAQAAPGGVVVHCHAGKDRTGIVVAMLLALVGVPDDVIVADYALSGLKLAELAREWLDGITQDPIERAALLRQAEPTREAMHETLDHLHGRHGGPDAYLLRGGATPDDLAALRARLVDLL
jgi:protein tyrosine/serine phosphatase